MEAGYLTDKMLAAYCVPRTAKKAVAHESFAITNPNKVRSVMRKFSANQTAFHAKDGSGYDFVADMTVKLDGLNPLVAADTVKPLTAWRKFDPERQGMTTTDLPDSMPAATLIAAKRSVMLFARSYCAFTRSAYSGFPVDAR